MPIAAKNSASCGPSGAAPDAAILIRPPSRSLTFENTTLSATFNKGRIQSGTDFPDCLILAALVPRRTAVSNSFWADAGRFRISVWMVAYMRSHTRGGAKKTVGRTVLRSEGRRERLSENQ